MNKLCGVYLIESPGRTRYIGGSRDIVRRWKQHRRALELGTHENFLLQRAHDAHGELTFTVLEICAPDDLHAREQAFIDDFGFDNLCNLQPRAGAGGSVGRVASQEERARMSAARRGRKHTAETREKIGAAQRGRTLPESQVAKIRASKTGKHIKRAIGKSGYKGVVFSQGKWVARVTKPTGGDRHLGRFPTADSAYAMRLAWLAVEGWL